MTTFQSDKNLVWKVHLFCTHRRTHILIDLSVCPNFRVNLDNLQAFRSSHRVLSRMKWSVSHSNNKYKKGSQITKWCVTTRRHSYMLAKVTSNADRRRLWASSIEIPSCPSSFQQRIIFPNCPHDITLLYISMGFQCQIIFATRHESFRKIVRQVNCFCYYAEEKVVSTVVQKAQKKLLRFNFLTLKKREPYDR